NQRHAGDMKKRRKKFHRKKQIDRKHAKENHQYYWTEHQCRRDEKLVLRGRRRLLVPCQGRTVIHRPGPGGANDETPNQDYGGSLEILDQVGLCANTRTASTARCQPFKKSARWALKVFSG